MKQELNVCAAGRAFCISNGDFASQDMGPEHSHPTGIDLTYGNPGVSQKPFFLSNVHLTGSLNDLMPLKVTPAPPEGLSTWNV